MRQLVLVALFILSCASKPVAPNEIRFTHYHFDHGFTDKQRAAVLTGMTIWERGLGGLVKFTQSDVDGWQLRPVFSRNDLPRSEWPRKENGDIEENWVGACGWPHITLIAPWLSEVETVAASVHEWGHAFGLPHNKKNAGSCMTPHVNPSCVRNGALPDVDRKAYCELHGCP